MLFMLQSSGAVHKAKQEKKKADKEKADKEKADKARVLLDKERKERQEMVAVEVDRKLGILRGLGNPFWSGFFKIV